jgi:hypothetical protein
LARYKLFSLADIRHDGSGKFKTALFEASLTRLGPGVFFALFGVYVLVTSLRTQIDVSTVEKPITVAAIPHLDELRSIINKLPESVEKKHALELISNMQSVSPEKFPSFTGHMYLYVLKHDLSDVQMCICINETLRRLAQFHLPVAIGSCAARVFGLRREHGGF